MYIKFDQNIPYGLRSWQVTITDQRKGLDHSKSQSSKIWHLSFSLTKYCQYQWVHKMWTKQTIHDLRSASPFNSFDLGKASTNKILLNNQFGLILSLSKRTRSSTKSSTPLSCLTGEHDLKVILLAWSPHFQSGPLTTLSPTVKGVPPVGIYDRLVCGHGEGVVSEINKIVWKVYIQQIWWRLRSAKTSFQVFHKSQFCYNTLD